MEIIPRILTLQTNPWTGWILLSLLICALLMYQRGKREDVLQMLLIGIFLCGTMGMTICLAIDSSSFDVSQWLEVSGLFACLEVARWICYRMVAFIFEIKLRNTTLASDYFRVWTYVSYACYLLCLGVFAFGEIPGMLIVLAVLFAAEQLWILFVVLREYLHSFEDLFYVLLSVVTIEILPILGFAYLVLYMADYKLPFEGVF